jgi:hypothetical protein
MVALSPPPFSSAIFISDLQLTSSVAKVVVLDDRNASASNIPIDSRNCLADELNAAIGSWS